jgi:hypothetical protein
MGIPYSKEINKAFVELNNAYGQVTPLVAAAYEVLETTKNISLLVAGVQVLNSFLLATILACMVGLLITMNPEMEKERKELVTPVMLWVAGLAKIGKRIASGVIMLVIVAVVGSVMFVKREGRTPGPVESLEEGQVEEDGQEKEGEEGEKEEEKDEKK